MTTACSRTATRAQERELFAQYRRDADPALRDELVERSLPLARHLAARYAARGDAADDVFQVACLALVKAVDRFEPDRGVAFSTYAVPTVVGEIKRYFRDQTWTVHVTRELRERAVRATRVRPDASRRAGRRFPVAEIAAAVGGTEEEAREALRAAAAYATASLDAPLGGDDGRGLTLADTIGGDDELLTSVEQRADLAGLVGRLTPRERIVLRLRFEHDLTLPEIARAMGISRPRAARILRGALERLRRLAEEPPQP
jgi:RNA polymerase sigma-B factor